MRLFRHSFMTVFFAVLCFLLSAVARRAYAQLSFTFTPSGTLTGSPGSQIALTGTITNIGTQEIDLLGGSATITGPNPAGLFLDDTQFLANLPLSLLGGEQYLGSLFLEIGANAAPGTYTVAYVIEGEGAAGTPNAGVPYAASASPSVIVASPAVNAAEPSTIVLSLFGVVGLAVLASKASSCSSAYRMKTYR
jgi:hypothetical protein